MNQSKIPVRYAKALFLLGKEKGVLTGLAGDAKLLADFFNSTPDLMPWLQNPIVKMDVKKDLFHRQFKGRMSPLFFRFIELVISKKRERFFPDILRNFINFQKAEAGIKTMVLTTAIEVDDTLKQKISLDFSKNNKTEHDLVARVKPSIIGGFMLQIDDLLYDASLATELKRLSDELTGQMAATGSIQED